jgi:hypothetical protein
MLVLQKHDTFDLGSILCLFRLLALKAVGADDRRLWKVKVKVSVFHEFRRVKKFVAST